MARSVLFGVSVLLLVTLFLPIWGVAQEDKIVQVAIETLKAQPQIRSQKGVEIKFVEKKESRIPDFYIVKLALFFPAEEIPIIVYVDKAGEKVILGSLFIKGENVTRKEAGVPKPRKMNMGQFEIEKSPFRGNAGGKVTILEFSNFQCIHCLRSWMKVKELLEKYPQDIKYVFKNFPPPEGKVFELSEIAASTQEVSQEAFWVVHDFLFSDEGQALMKEEKETIIKKIEQILREKGYDINAFQAALLKGNGKKRVEEDIAVGRKIQVMLTPTIIVNGDLIRVPLSEKVIEQYLDKRQ